ncbi:MAG: histidine--tRNA ligase [Actinobacteria bacterium]|nr:histidine--tRNA ligase [Actinomycetota bacterium]MBU1942280.1 histidine--tRNA ligase [Actinomycetota bacterium]MBU2687371.1 histidine--tRNA ligase [Actinomycetota bacterium]
MTRYKAPRGTSDLVFPDSEKMERLIETACALMRERGYRRIDTPILEDTELFARSIGEETDIVTKEMYNFEDRGGESLTMRPEGTAPVVRAYLERGLASRGLPVKVYYVGPMFRRERPQAGRFRQFTQIGGEAIGSEDPFLDAEIISFSDALFARLGLERYRLLVNSVGCRECRPAYVDRLRSFLEAMKGGLCEQCVRRTDTNPLRVFDCKNERCRATLKGAPTIGEHLCPRCREHFDALLGHLDTMGMTFEVDERMVRGLDYYTNTAFEFQFEGLGAQNTVCGGGRYDGLTEELGGPPTPGVGYSMGLERLLMALEAEGLDPFVPERLQVFLAAAPGVQREPVLDLLGRLRAEGISADTDFMGRGLKAQMKQADRLGARVVVMIGEEELASGEVTLRDLDASEQWRVPAKGLVERIRQIL